MGSEDSRTDSSNAERIEVTGCCGAQGMDEVIECCDGTGDVARWGGDCSGINCCEGAAGAAALLSVERTGFAARMGTGVVIAMVEEGGGYPYARD